MIFSGKEATEEGTWDQNWEFIFFHKQSIQLCGFDPKINADFYTLQVVLFNKMFDLYLYN